MIKDNGIIKRILSLILSVIIMLGAVVIPAYAAEVEDESVTINFSGKEIEVVPDGDGVVRVLTELDGEKTIVEIPPNFIIDDEEISTGDSTVENIIPLSFDFFKPRSPSSPLTRATTPPVTRDMMGSLSGDLSQDPDVTMNGKKVSSRRYTVVFDGIQYEAYCANPNLPGPESDDGQYAIVGPAPANIAQVLKNGYPINSGLSSYDLDTETRMWNVYCTRVAVGMVNNPDATFAGEEATVNAASALLTGDKNVDAQYPALMVNDVVDDVFNAGDIGEATIAKSDPFTVSYNRRVATAYNNFKFEWASGTPSGARLYVDGTLLMTAPNNSDRIFTGDITSFYIEMDNTPENKGKEAKVNLVSPHNEYTGAWMLQRMPVDEWQDICFYIPFMQASATLTFTSDKPSGGTPTPTLPNRDPRTAVPPAVRIQKVDALTRKNIPDALVRISGGSSFQMTTGDGQIWEIDNTGIDISVVLTAGHTLPVVPEPSEEGRPPVSFELINGVLTIHNIPWGYYKVEEERAPQGYSLLPQHTAYSFWVLPPNVTVTAGLPAEGDGEGDPVEDEESIIPFAEEEPDVEGGGDDSGSSGGIEYLIDEEENVNSILVTFENYPFGTIELTKVDEITGKPLSGALFRIEGYFPEGNENGQPIYRMDTTNGSGKIKWDDLPAGMYTITEVLAPEGYRTSKESVAVPLTWGQDATVTVSNKPFGSLEIIKVDGNTGAPLSGAVFEVEYLFDDMIMQTTVTTGGNGKVELTGLPKTNVSIREIIAPKGYILSGDVLVYPIEWGQKTTVTVDNYHNPSLTIIKRDKDTQKPLSGAVFEVNYENGQTVQGSPFTTGANGSVTLPWTLFDGNPERTLIITEIVPPSGYHLSSPNWQRVTMRPGEDNTVTFENRRMPTITVEKKDAITGLPIPNAEFTIEKVDEPGKGMLTGNPFRTDKNGLFVLPFQHAGMYRITEVRAANNYWFDPLEQNRSWIIQVRENEDYLLNVENTLLPTLVITKMNSLTYRPVPLTQFKVEYEVPNSGNITLVGNYITDSKGQIIIPFVNVGWYRVTETRPAPGMALNTNNNYRVYLGAGQNTYAYINSTAVQQAMSETLSSVSTLTESEEPPETQGFLALDDETQQESSMSTDPAEVEPVVVLPDPADDDLPYDYEQIAAMSDNEIMLFLANDLQVTDGDTWLIGEEVWNWPLNSIVIKKTDATNGRLLQGATFDLIYTSTGESGTKGTVIGRFTTNHSGIIVLTGLEPGNYVVEESVPPNNYTLSINNRQNVYLRPDGYSIVEVEFSNLPYGSLLITKRDENTGQPLMGAEFRVTTSNGTVVGNANGLYTTNLQGEIVIPNLTPDTYIITEIQAPPGYELNSIPQTIKVEPSGEIYRVDFTNKPVSSLIIRKVDSYDGSPLAGSLFEVRKQSGEFVGQYVTDNTGIVEIQGLLGWYVVQEIQAPSGYALDANATRTVEVRSQSPAVITFYNPREGSLTIEKTDGYGNPLAGAKFEVRKQNGEYVGTYTTPASGMINLSDLTAGWYMVEEIQAPQGFIISQAGQSVEVKPNVAAKVTFSNQSLPVLTIKKIDEYGNPLAGAKFRVSHIGGIYVQDVVTGQGGSVSITLPLTTPEGNFEIVETQAPQGYVITESNKTVTMRAGESRTETFVNHRTPSLIIEKVDENGLPLSGAEFEVRRLNGQLITRVTTNQGGTATVDGLEPGNYEVIETHPPSGYVVIEQSKVIEMLAGENTTVRFVNRRSPSLIIEKVDENGLPLSGAEFEIRRLNGQLITRVVTNKGGTASIDGLEPGNYEVIETRPPTGYVVVEQSKVIEMFAGESTTVRFVNLCLPSLVVEKVDENGLPLSGAEFEVRRLNGQLITRVVTNKGGIASIDGLDPGNYEVIETRPPTGYALMEQSKVIEMVAGENATVRFVNLRLPSLIIEKVDENGLPLAGAEFEIRRLNGQLISRLTTNQGGIASYDNLEPGTYEVIETRPPTGYVVVEQSKVIDVVAGVNTTVRFINRRTPSLTIEKLDENGKPLAGAVFEIRMLNGQRIAEVTTNNGGIAVIDKLEPGSYEITETRPPDGYAIIEKSRVIDIAAGESKTERFINARLATFVISKIDGDTNEPLQGVIFEITTLTGERIKNPVNGSYEFTTDNAGMIRLPQLPAGSYVATETKALKGYDPAEPQVFVVDHDRDYIITVRNYRRADYTIRKIDGDTNAPLQGVQFEIGYYFANGTIGERIKNPLDGSYVWTTDKAGYIRIPALANGTYVAIEVKALPGYVEAEPTVFMVGDNQNTTITIRNYARPDYQIKKVDGDNNQPLPGVQFEIARYFGQGYNGERVRNPIDGSFVFTTDNNGLIRIPSMEQGTYAAIEVKPLAGYAAAEPTIFTVGGNENTTITIRNYRQANLSIQKIDSSSRSPIAGVVFQISKPNGDRVVNPDTGFFDFVTDNNGLIHLPVIEDGSYYLTEIKPASGYVGLSTPVAFEVNTQTRQREHVLVVENSPAAGLLIIKTDSQTGMPLAGVSFEIRHADGSIVQNSILDQNQPGTTANSPNITATGGFVTDSRGRIQLNHLSPGVYHVTETKALSGYQLDSTVYTVTVTPGKQAVLEVKNAQMAGLRLLKIDSITKEPIYNVEFMVLDSNNKVVGNFYTDNKGVIDFAAILTPGRYTIRETRAASGYYRDDVPRTVEFVAGRVTEVVWENVPEAGQIQVTKVSANDNEANGFPAGTPLADAIFEVYSYRTGNVVDRFITGRDGRGVSKPLPLGRYIVKEVQAPPYYQLNPKELDVTIEFATQIIRLEFANASANTGVSVRKTAPREVMPGQEGIRFEIKQIRNESTVALNDFYFRDVLPVEAIRVERIVTGTFNQSLRYKVLATTNKGDTITIADNLSTTQNNVIDTRNAALGLANDEFITSFTFYFGTVRAGFASVEEMQVYARVLNANFANGYQFSNRVDVGGQYQGVWVVGNSTTITSVYVPTPSTLPKTGR